MTTSLSKPRLAAFHRQGGYCYYCGAPMWLDKPAAFAAQHDIGEKLAARLQCTGEHLLARQDGGDSSRSNIVAACHYCNMTRHRRKKAPSADAYRQIVAQRVQGRKWHPPPILRLVKPA